MRYREQDKADRSQSAHGYDQDGQSEMTGMIPGKQTAVYRL